MRKNLYNLRIKLGLTQYQFADILGMSRSNYAMVEQGARGVTMTALERIQKALDDIDPGTKHDICALFFDNNRPDLGHKRGRPFKHGLDASKKKPKSKIKHPD